MCRRRSRRRPDPSYVANWIQFGFKLKLKVSVVILVLHAEPNRTEPSQAERVSRQAGSGRDPSVYAPSSRASIASKA